MELKVIFDECTDHIKLSYKFFYDAKLKLMQSKK
jgi:hypothetical protein